MPNVPVRGLAEKGILHDPSPYQLDLNAWSGGMNVRFHANKAERAPIFRTVIDTVAEEPVYVTALEPAGGYDTAMVVGATGRVWSYLTNVLTEITNVGWTQQTDPRAFTSTVCAEVLYLNRPDQYPQYYGPTSTTFVNLPNQETTWTCRSLRAFGSYLIALNITKPSTFVDPYTGLVQAGGTVTNMFKWSDLTLAGQVPGSWDPTDPTKSSGENVLEEITTPIVDGFPMREIFVIYAEKEIWAAQQNGGTSIFTWRKMFDEGGMLAPNCAVEVDGLHYVFGSKDIYKHDGTTKTSIIDKRNKQFLFRNLNKAKSEVCFVQWMPQYDSIIFGLNSGETTCKYQGVDRCNLGAIYDLSADTWSFVDLPNVSGFAQSNLDTILTYSNTPATTLYSNVGGSFYDQDNTFVKNVVAVSGTTTGVTKHRLLAYDFFNKGNLAFPYEPEVNGPAFLERTGVALDQFGSDLTTFKKIRRLYPLVSMFESVPITITVGGSNTPSGAVVWGTPHSFDPTAGYKVDGIDGGRYLAVRFSLAGPQDFEVAGFDLDVTNGGRR